MTQFTFEGRSVSRRLRHLGREGQREVWNGGGPGWGKVVVGRGPRDRSWPSVPDSTFDWRAWRGPRDPSWLSVPDSTVDWDGPASRTGGWHDRDLTDRRRFPSLSASARESVAGPRGAWYERSCVLRPPRIVAQAPRELCVHFKRPGIPSPLRPAPLVTPTSSPSPLSTQELGTCTCLLGNKVIGCVCPVCLAACVS